MRSDHAATRALNVTFTSAPAIRRPARRAPSLLSRVLQHAPLAVGLALAFAVLQYVAR